MTNKKEVAQKVMEAFYKDWTDDEHIDDKPAVVNVLRQLVFELQYYQCCEDAGVEDMVLDARAILDVCDELEVL